MLAEPVYAYIVSGLYSSIDVSVSDIPEGILKFVIQKVMIRGLPI